MQEKRLAWLHCMPLFDGYKPASLQTDGSALSLDGESWRCRHHRGGPIEKQLSNPGWPALLETHLVPRILGRNSPGFLNIAIVK